MLTAGVLVGCKTKQTPQQPTTGSFIAEIVNTLGKKGHACFDRGDDELCVAKAARPVSTHDLLEPHEALQLCTRVAGKLGDCRDLRAEPELGVEYTCEQGTCFCEGVASCTLLGADCVSGGTCGTCALGDCCCPEAGVRGPQIGVAPLREMP
ncbi:MAG: hypothetical protein R6X02_23575 [Enhygromyxa sp.]